MLVMRHEKPLKEKRGYWLSRKGTFGSGKQVNRR